MNSDLAPAERDILVIVPEDCLLFEAAGIADIFCQANSWVGEGQPTMDGARSQAGRVGRDPRPAETRPYSVTIATQEKDRLVKGRSGLSLLADHCLLDLDPHQSRNTVIVTGRGSSPAEQAALAAWFSAAGPHLNRVVSVCTGAFILADAGLLEGREATTHWRALSELEAKYPAVKVQKGPIFVRDGSIWTSAGASSGFDLCLALIEEDLGFEVAKAVAQFLVLFLRRPGGQSQFSSYLSHQASREGPIRRVQSWAIEHLDSDLGVPRLAEEAAMSPRNFARVFARETGTSPARYIEEIRLESARQRLEMGDETIDEIAFACGMGSALTLRRNFERELGINPTEYRQRFGRK